MEIIPLGTNGFFPSFGRQTACFAVPLGKKLIVLDAGSGLFRFAEPEGKELLQGVGEVHLFLSHYHLDHTMGLYAAFRLWEKKKVTIFAPSGIQKISDYLDWDKWSERYSSIYKNFGWQFLNEGRYNSEDYEFSIRQQNHRGDGSLAFRFRLAGREFAYVTDSEPAQESIDFVRGVSLLLHEHDIGGENILRRSAAEDIKSHFSGTHVTTVGAALTAKRAQVGKLVLIHHYPFYDSLKLRKLGKLSATIFPQSVISDDLQEISF
ncbi:ribonuclease Z [Patescibacteria group bacterium]|nr:ribonuclease Z [Patescibacteria group bacterium]MCL5798103.1 ribonuclease Z [Patescibacteria group bacterium]